MFDRLIAIRPIGRREQSACPPQRPAHRVGCGDWSIFALLLAAVSFTAAPANAETPADGGEKLRAWKTNGWPLMQSFCIDCHNADFKEAGLDLSRFESLSDLSASEIKRVVEMVRFGAMPPEDYDTPEIEERKKLVTALEETMFSATCDLRPQAGKVTARRLNRSEYNHSIRDLFGLDLQPANQFPSDEVGGGFDNNGDVLSLSPMLIEKYLQAAETVSQAVLVDPDDLPKLSLDAPGDQLAIYGEPLVGSFYGRFIDRDSFLWVDLELPYEGEYSISVRGGVTDEKADPIPVAICDEDGLVLAVDKLKYFGGGGSGDSMRQTVSLSKGKHRLLFVPIHDERELKVGEDRLDVAEGMDPERVKAIKAKLGQPVPVTRGIDAEAYPFMFRALSVSGPKRRPESAFPPKQFEIIRKRPSGRPGRYRDVTKTAMENLKPLMRRMFRGPVSDDDVRPYAELVKQTTDESKSFYRGMQIAVSALLVSPRFLFRVETPAAETKPNEFGDLPLSQHQLATRLSYFLWSSTPDEALLDLADRGELKAATVQQQIDRMLKDPRADALAANFAAQWLGLRNLAGHDADEAKYPMFTDELKSAMNRETELFFMHVVRNNLPISEFLTADYTFANETLARHYGLDRSGDDAKEFQQVSLTETPRRGLLSHASILTLTSTPTRTSPVLRGKWILENILGIKAPEPPAGVPDLDETQAAADNATLREQLELHRQSPSCASCHRVMDQLGFGLDDFNAVGQFRTEDAGQPIDASGALPDGRSFNGGAELSKMLGKTETSALARTLIERLLTFAIGRELTPDDRCTIDEIVAETQPDQFRLADIVAAVVHSRQFRFQTVERINKTTSSDPQEDREQ